MRDKQSFELRGLVSYHALGAGFFGLVDAQNRRWLLLDLPPSAQKYCRQQGPSLMQILVQQGPQGPNIMMWGQAVQVLEVLTPPTN